MMNKIVTLDVPNNFIVLCSTIAFDFEDQNLVSVLESKHIC